MMRTPASVARHPIHPMLVAIPIGLWIFSFVCDLVVYFSEGREVGVQWFVFAYWTMAGGLVGALLAAIPGLIDFLSLKDRRIRTLATTHMSINLGLVALYGLNLWLRRNGAPDFLLCFGLSAIGIVLLGLSGWIGGEMVHVHGVSVTEPELAKSVAVDRAPLSESSSTHLGHA